MKMAEPLTATFRKPFSEQVATFRLRLGNLVPTARWDDISRSAHDRAFMVAGAMKADLLADLGSAVDKAITEGTGIEAFRADFRQIVSRHGWHGWHGRWPIRFWTCGQNWISCPNARQSILFKAGCNGRLFQTGLKRQVEIDRCCGFRPLMQSVLVQSKPWRIYRPKPCANSPN